MRVPVPITDYFDVTPEEVVSTFKTAYAAAGFRFESRQDWRAFSELEFSYPVSERLKGRLFLGIGFSRTAGPPPAKCSPCGVRRGGSGVVMVDPHVLSEADFPAIDRATLDMDRADAKANEAVARVLGHGLK